MRTLYAIAGIAVIIQSAGVHSWVGIIFGVYFTSMGVFGFGCAAGNCFGGSCATADYKKQDGHENISFEEVKEKRNGNEG